MIKQIAIGTSRCLFARLADTDFDVLHQHMLSRPVEPCTSLDLTQDQNGRYTELPDTVVTTVTDLVQEHAALLLELDCANQTVRFNGTGFQVKNLTLQRCLPQQFRSAVRQEALFDFTIWLQVGYDRRSDTVPWGLMHDRTGHWDMLYHNPMGAMQTQLIPVDQHFVRHMMIWPAAFAHIEYPCADTDVCTWTLNGQIDQL